MYRYETQRPTGFSSQNTTNTTTTTDVCLKTTYCTFEKAKAPAAVVQALSASGFFVAMAPGTISENHCATVAVMMPVDTDCAAVEARLGTCFQDVTSVVDECCTFRVGIPANELKTGLAALATCSIEIGKVDRIADGFAYCTVTTTTNVTVSTIVDCLMQCEICPSCVDPCTTTTNNNTASTFNAAFTPFNQHPAMFQNGNMYSTNAFANGFTPFNQNPTMFQNGFMPAPTMFTNGFTPFNQNPTMFQNGFMPTPTTNSHGFAMNGGTGWQGNTWNGINPTFTTPTTNGWTNWNANQGNTWNANQGNTWNANNTSQATNNATTTAACQMPVGVV